MKYRMHKIGGKSREQWMKGDKMNMTKSSEEHDNVKELWGKSKFLYYNNNNNNNNNNNKLTP